MEAGEIKSQLEFIGYSKEVHVYSKAVGKLLDLYTSYIYDIEKSYEKGEKNAIWCGAFYASSWEAPLLYACDIVPASFTEMGRLSDQEAIQIAEDYYQFPVETCSMVKCTVGQWHLRRRGAGIKRILGANSSCEPYNLAWEIMKKEGYDVHNIDVIYRAPGVTGERLEHLVEFCIKQLYGIVEWLTGSREIDEEKLRIEIKRKNRLMAKVRKILDLRLKHPFYIRSVATIILINMGLANYFGKPEAFEDAVDLLIEEMENIPINKNDLKRVIPLIWAGGTGQEFGIYEAIDQAGGALLGFRSAPVKNIREDLPPMEALARYVCDSQRCGAEIYLRDRVEQEVNRINARGLVLYGYIGCSYSSIEKEMLSNYFHEKGLPCINLEGTFRVGMTTGQILTRVNAFIEMLSPNVVA